MKRILLLLISLIPLTAASPEMTGAEIIDQMLQAIRSTKGLQFKLKDYERIEGTIREGEEDIKIMFHPLKIYARTVRPDAGIEVLWVKGANKGKAWVHPNKFPFFTVSLDPNDKMMHAGHHSIFETNLNYFADIISDLKSRTGNDFTGMVSQEGDIEFDGKPCYKIVISNPSFKHESYTVGQSENLLDIARKKHVCEYMILKKNPSVKNYKDVHSGQTITLPSFYAQKTIIYVDKETKLPLAQMIYDDEGLFEKYEYYRMKPNPEFTEMDFSKQNPEYHFRGGKEKKK